MLVVLVWCMMMVVDAAPVRFTFYFELLFVGSGVSNLQTQYEKSEPIRTRGGVVFVLKL